MSEDLLVVTANLYPPLVKKSMQVSNDYYNKISSLAQIKQSRMKLPTPLATGGFIMEK